MKLYNPSKLDAVLNWGQLRYVVPAQGSADIPDPKAERMMKMYPFLNNDSKTESEIVVEEKSFKRRGRPRKRPIKLNRANNAEAEAEVEAIQNI